MREISLQKLAFWLPIPRRKESLKTLDGRLGRSGLSEALDLFESERQAVPGGEMYLRSLRISRFRSCEVVSVPFQSDLTVLVGENNGGKSNIVDAVRLLTLPLSGRSTTCAGCDKYRD
jgi:AAA ATPase-like protein